MDVYLPRRILQLIPLGGGLAFSLLHERERHILGLYGIPNSDSKKKIAFAPVINNHAFGPGKHEAGLQKIYNTISPCWELPADNEARFMGLLFP